MRKLVTSETLMSRVQYTRWKERKRTGKAILGSDQSEMRTEVT